MALGTDGWPAEMDVERAALQRLGKAHGEAEASLHEREEGGFALLNWLTKLHTGAVDLDATADLVVGVPGQRPRHVVVAGRPVVKDGQLAGAEVEEIRAHAHEQAARLWARL